MRMEMLACERAAHADGLAAGLALVLDGVDPAAAPGRFAAVVSPLGEITYVESEPQKSSNRTDLNETCAHLVNVRLGVTRRLLDYAVERLAGRFVGGEPTIRKQLVLGTVADAVTAVEALRQLSQPPYPSAAALADAHDQITGLDWEIIKLLGASGFVAGGPADQVRLSELVANCWVPREGVSSA